LINVKNFCVFITFSFIAIYQFFAQFQGKNNIETFGKKRWKKHSRRTWQLLRVAFNTGYIGLIKFSKFIRQ